MNILLLIVTGISDQDEIMNTFRQILNVLKWINMKPWLSFLWTIFVIVVSYVLV